jgi:hypothetical protein
MVLVCVTACSDAGNGTAAAEPVPEETVFTESVPGEGIDVDLTQLSSTMVYAEVFNIMSNPDFYMGKTIKVNGPYYPLYYEDTELYYHFVIVEDATECCQQGLEFSWDGEHAYPADYPQADTDIEVVGIFDSYEELGETFYYLKVEDVVVL